MRYMGFHPSGKKSRIQKKGNLYHYEAEMGNGSAKYLDTAQRLAQADSFTIQEHKEMLRQVHQDWMWEPQSLLAESDTPHGK